MKRIRDSAEPRRRRSSGQSMVEFVLVFPILMILLVAIADFARIFATSVVVEAATRNAAEITALEYTRNPPGDSSLTPAQRLAAAAPASGTYYNATYYDDLHEKAASAVCAEARVLPNTDFQPDGTCKQWPLIRICIHDGVGTNCGQPVAPNFRADTPADCDDIPAPGSPDWDPSMQGGTESGRYVEVRVCYRYTPILPGSPFLPIGEIYVQRTRMFTVQCWQDPATASC